MGSMINTSPLINYCFLFLIYETTWYASSNGLAKKLKKQDTKKEKKKGNVIKVKKNKKIKKGWNWRQKR